MNAFERAVAVVENKMPDRIPTMEIMIDPKVMKALNGTDDYMDFCDYFDMEFVVTNTPSLLYRKTILDEEEGVFVNEWGIKRKESIEVVSSLLEPSLKTYADIKNFKAPNPYDDYRYIQLGKLIKRFKGKRLVGMHLHDSFNYPYYLRGMENLFMDMYDTPELVHHLVKISVDHNIAIARKAIEMGADFIILGDDYGASTSLLVAPDQWREFFLPGLQQIVTAVKDAGGYCFKHCCGNINSILDDIVGTGIDVLHPLDPSAGMDIIAVKEKHKELTVMGGINCYEPLSEFTIEELEKTVINAIETIGKGGRYIMASSNSVHSDVKPENYKAMNNIRINRGIYN